MICFLRKVLKRPKNEKAVLLIPVGYPACDAMVPVLSKKPLDEILGKDKLNESEEIDDVVETDDFAEETDDW